jgi:hypothetical protein
LATGPSGPFATPLTRDVEISDNWKFTSVLSSPDFRLMTVACAGAKELG